jgi:hypothetical protein
MLPPGCARLAMSADRIGNLNEHDRNGAGFFSQGDDRWGHVTNNYVRLQCDQRFREGLDPGGIAGRPATINSKVAALHPSQFLQRLMERVHHRLRFRIALGKIRQHANPPHPLGLLRASREWPHRRCTAQQQRYELPSSHVGHGGLLPRLSQPAAPLAYHGGGGRSLGRPELF